MMIVMIQEDHPPESSPRHRYQSRSVLCQLPLRHRPSIIRRSNNFFSPFQTLVEDLEDLLTTGGFRIDWEHTGLLLIKLRDLGNARNRRDMHRQFPKRSS